jgi:hypothetical protein
VVDVQHIIVTISVINISYCVLPVFFLQDKYTQVIRTNYTIPTLILKLYDLKELCPFMSGKTVIIISISVINGLLCLT